jgi:hypothetical protein
MGTQQSRSGHGRQGSSQQGQQSDHRPQQDRDLQRNKQSDRGQQQQQGDRGRQHQEGDRGHQPQGDAGSAQSAGSDASRQQDQNTERQQSQLGGNRDFTHKMENEGRQQNREQQNVSRQQSQDNVHGEGNYAATRQYNQATKDFMASGGVEPAARAASPKSDAERRQMDEAEAEGKRHAKGEDPGLARRSSKTSPDSPEAPRPGHEKE